MRRIFLDELKQIQIEILNVFTNFCDTHDLKYWLDSGTLLGAVRHKGYIPWDDDIDTGMLRPDFNRCMELFNQENDRYKFYCIENNKEFCYPFAKVIDTHTVLYEPNKKGNRTSVNIDVFVYDNAPDDNKALDKMFKVRDFWKQMEYLRLPYNVNNTGIRKLVGESIRIIPRLFPKWYFSYKISQNSKKYSENDTKRVGDFTGFSNVSESKELFSDFIKVQFEGKEYNAPIGYDKWLNAFYGDYMELPPIEEQVPHHKFEAFWED